MILFIRVKSKVPRIHILKQRANRNVYIFAIIKQPRISRQFIDSIFPKKLDKHCKIRKTLHSTTAISIAVIESLPLTAHTHTECTIYTCKLDTHTSEFFVKRRARALFFGKSFYARLFLHTRTHTISLPRSLKVYNRLDKCLVEPRALFVIVSPGAMSLVYK